MTDDLGLYISVPFCQAKCSFCNFASDRFAPGLLPAYLRAVTEEIQQAPARAAALQAHLPRSVTSVYLGGGTPSLLAPSAIRDLFQAIDSTFTRAPLAEVTVECAPGQLSPDSLLAFRDAGVNRISFGVQSFVEAESAAVGRTHTARQCREEIDRVRLAGIEDVGLDLIAGLPHQTESSWLTSLDLALQSGVTHISIYLLEIDEDSRLGREALAAGPRYGAPALPSEDLTVRLYELACERLAAAGLLHYEISNFARPGFLSRHNSRYWAREPYLGVGLDAHSMLLHTSGRGLRFSNPDTMEQYLPSSAPLPLLQAAADPVHLLSVQEELEETLFLGLRRSSGVHLQALATTFPAPLLAQLEPVFTAARTEGLLEPDPACLRLTPRGRLLSNDLFSRFLLSGASAAA